MAVTSGFFNSRDGDRKYSAEQFSSIFDNLIIDGVFANIGTAFAVTATGGNNITVGIGRAWFNSIWLLNDTVLPMTAQGSEVVQDRIDAVVIEIDHTDAVRAGSIKFVYGTPANTPVRPTMANTNDVHQYPLAYIYRTAGNSDIKQADITNMVGTNACPYVTGILETIGIDNVVAQWEAEWDIWKTHWTQWEAEWDQWIADKSEDADAETAALLSDMKSEFDAWFNNLQALLDGDVAANLANEIAIINGRFTTLAKERSVYEEIQDSTNDTLEDSNGNPIEGRTILGGDGGGSGGSSEPVTLESIGAAAKEHAEQHASDGEDPITPSMIGAAAAEHSHDEITNGDYKVYFLNGYDLRFDKLTGDTYSATIVHSMNMHSILSINNYLKPLMGTYVGDGQGNRSITFSTASTGYRPYFLIIDLMADLGGSFSINDGTVYRTMTVQFESQVFTYPIGTAGNAAILNGIDFGVRGFSITNAGTGEKKWNEEGCTYRYFALVG